MLCMCFLLLTRWCATTHGLVYPSESETRQVRSLNGVWEFRTDNAGVEESERWFPLPRLPEPTTPKPVPSSCNDITQNVSIYRFFGIVWYAKDSYIHKTAPHCEYLVWLH